MAEVNTAEAEAKADAAFGAGFGVTPPAEIPPAKVGNEPVVEPAKPDAVAVPAVVPEKPQYVRLTKQELDLLKTRAGKVDSLESQVAKLAGNAPNAEKIAAQVLENLRSQTPAGLTVEIADADFAEMAEDFPELAAKTRAALERVLRKANVKGTGPATPPAQPVDVSAEVDKVLLRREEQALVKAYPDWSDIVGRPPAEGAAIPEGNPFRQWLAKQSAEYQKAVNETDSPADVRDAIAAFKASQSAPPSSRSDRAAARRAVIEDAVTPRADGNPPPLNQPQTAEDAFANAFKAAKSH